MITNVPRLLLAAPRSGGGKTTLACGLLQLLKDRGLTPAAFKCGPDYVDPLFHRRVVGVKSGNLDLFFTGEPVVRSLLVEGAEDCDIALLEGVMGYYDGISSDSTEGSSYHLAKATLTPVLLVLDAGGISLSLAALVNGFADFRPDANIQGILLNRCSRALYNYLAPSLQLHTGIPVLGYLPKDPRYAIESRHLGLVAADEIADLQERLGLLANTLQDTLDVDQILQIAASAPPLYHDCHPPEAPAGTVRLAVAHDDAFCFYYQENRRLLEQMGVSFVSFSPLRDRTLPPQMHGLYLGGGYPELHAKQLSENSGMRAAIRAAVESGLPVVAEGGGFLYLQETLADDTGNPWPMVGALEGSSQNAQQLKQFGYIDLTAQQDNLYANQGESIRAHEYHYWQSTAPGDAFWAQKPKRDTGWPCMAAKGNLIAGFPHLYYPANPAFAACFVEKMRARRQKEEKE